MSEEQHPDPIVRWTNRRRMAWAAVSGGLLYPLLLLVTQDEILASLAWPYFAFVGSIAGAYVGTAAWETISISKAAK